MFRKLSVNSSSLTPTNSSSSPSGPSSLLMSVIEDTRHKRGLEGSGVGVSGTLVSGDPVPSQSCEGVWDTDSGFPSLL